MLISENQLPANRQNAPKAAGFPVASGAESALRGAVT